MTPQQFAEVEAIIAGFNSPVNWHIAKQNGRVNVIELILRATLPDGPRTLSDQTAFAIGRSMLL